MKIDWFGLAKAICNPDPLWEREQIDAEVKS
jgi:hypothetical protein